MGIDAAPPPGVLEGAGSILGGPLGAIAGSAVSGLIGRSSAKSQMKFQERMANTQYQRAAKDLEAAGLNRVLALGSGASAPAGAGYSAPDLGQSATSGRQAETASRGQQSTAGLQSAQVNSAKAQQANTEAQTALINGTAPAQIRKANAEATSAEKNATRDAIITQGIERVAPYLVKGADAIEAGITGAKDAVQSLSTKAQDVIESGKSSARQLFQGTNPKESSIPGFFDFLTSPSKWFYEDKTDYSKQESDSDRRRKARQKDKEYK